MARQSKDWLPGLFSRILSSYREPHPAGANQVAASGAL
jgi:hypothetical protein